MKPNPYWKVRDELNTLAELQKRPLPFPDNPQYLDGDSDCESGSRSGRPTIFQPGFEIPDTLLTVVEAKPSKGGVLARLIRCRCSCGQERDFRYPELYPWPRYSCGCASRPRKVSEDRDLAGREFGRLTCLRYDTGLGWLCLCSSCGGTHHCRTAHLERSGDSPCPKSPQDRSCWEFELLLRHRGITTVIPLAVYHEPTLENAIKALKTGLVARIKGNREEFSL